MTNYEKIKVMSVEEMAESLAQVVDCTACPVTMECGYWEPKSCREHWTEILLQEAEE